MRLQNGYDPIVPRDFLQKRHLRQSHCKMSIPTFVHTVVLSLLTFIKIRLAQMLWYFGFILTFFPSKRLGCKKRHFRKASGPILVQRHWQLCSYQLCRRWLLYTEVGQMCLAVIKTKKNCEKAVVKSGIGSNGLKRTQTSCGGQPLGGARLSQAGDLGKAWLRAPLRG